MQELLLDANQAASVLNVGKKKIYRMVRAKEIPSICVGSSVRIPLEPLYDWIRSRTTEAVSKQEAD